MTQSYEDFRGKWKTHTHKIRVTPVRPDEVEERHRFSATIIEVMKERTDQKPTWVEVSGWPEQRFLASTKDEALHEAYEAVKTWIDEQEEEA